MLCYRIQILIHISYQIRFETLLSVNSIDTLTYIAQTFQVLSHLCGCTDSLLKEGLKEKEKEHKNVGMAKEKRNFLHLTFFFSLISLHVHWVKA
jgi:hypothetical protein